MYIFVKLISRFVCLLPFALRRWIGDVVGSACWLLVPGDRKKLAIENICLSLQLDEQEAKQIAKRSVTRFGRMFMEVLYFPRITPDNIRKYVTMEGEEHLREALQDGKGVVLATAHSGNWELLGAALAMCGFPLVAVVQRQTNAAMDRFINEYRTIAGMKIEYKTGVRDMVRLLHAGKIIGLLMDQDAHHGVFVDFFGREASTPPGAAALSRLTDAPIVPAFISNSGDGAHRVTIYPAFSIETTPDREQDILHTTQKLTKIIEDHIRLYPQEWFWLHNRWKTRRKE